MTYREFPTGGSTGRNVVRCKRTGQGIAVLLGGGVCACNSVEDCPFLEENDEQTSKPAT